MPAGDSDSSARLRLAQAGLAYVAELDDGETVAPVVLDRVRRSLTGAQDTHGMRNVAGSRHPGARDILNLAEF